MNKEFIFSKRTDWELSTNQLADALKDLKDKNIEIIDLTQSNPTQCDFNYLNGALLDSFQKKENLKYDPSSMGLKQAREVIAKLYSGHQINPDNIFLCSSTSEAYSFVFKLIANPGDEVLFPLPSYPLFDFLGQINDVNLKYYPLIYDHEWKIDFERLIFQISSKTKAIVLVNPNNPTGSYIKKEELKKLNEICLKHQLALISDEVFWDYSLDSKNNHVTLADNQPVLSFTLGGISKTLGLPQMKLSWIMLNGPKDLLSTAKSRLDVIADTFLSVNTPVQHALAQWISFKDLIQNEIKSRLKENLNFLNDQVNKMKSCKLFKVEGGWYTVIRIPLNKTEEEWMLKFLNNYHVSVHPGYFYDFEEDGFMIISLLPETKKFQEGVLRILARMEQEVG